MLDAVEEREEREDVVDEESGAMSSSSFSLSSLKTLPIEWRTEI